MGASESGDSEAPSFMTIYLHTDLTNFYYICVIFLESLRMCLIPTQFNYL